MSLTVTHSTAADGTFSTAGETAWEANHTLVGNAMKIGDTLEDGTPGQILFVGTGPVLDDDANLTFTPTGGVGSGPKLTVGSGTTTSVAGTIGYTGYSGYGALWLGAADVSVFGVAALIGNATDLQINSANSTGLITFTHGNGGAKLTLSGTAGAGPSITAGTATTDVAALSVTRTNNDASVATGVKWTFTDTTSAAGFLPMQILGTSGGATNLFSVSKTGGITTGVPAGGTAAAWKFGTVASVSPLVPNRTIELDVNGTIYYLHAKTTND